MEFTSNSGRPITRSEALLLEPGVAVSYASTSGAGNPNNFFQVSVNGAPQSMTVISFDGARRETYEHIRRRASYDHTLERVRLLKRRMAPATLCAANCTVMRANVEEVGESVTLWDEIGFDQIRFIAMVVRNPVMEAESIFPLRERYHANLDAAAEELIARRRRISMASPYFHQSRLRLTHPRAGVLMLTARAGELDEVAGLDAGADDYVRKPFTLAVLIAPALFCQV